jgi:uncharacterized membrane protein YdjX (TVP38/TMEM64 family)
LTKGVAMKGHWVKIIVLLAIIVAAILAKFLSQDDILSIHNVKTHREQLLQLVRDHYWEAVLCYVSLYVGTAFILPGALALTIAGGMMFGTVPTVVYVNVGGTAGAVLAFYSARFVIGGWIQERFKKRLESFNREMAQHGPNYLLVLRLVPFAPFFVVNYGAGITKIPWKTFLWTTSLGMIPGSLIYAYLGEQLRTISTATELFSGKLIIALLILAFFALLPIIYQRLPVFKK